MANDLIRIRRDIYTNWTAANPVLALGEISYDLTNDEIRVGDGTTAWLSLPAVGSANLSDGSKGDIVVSSGGTVWSLSSALVAEIAAKLEASDLNLGTSTTPATTPLQIRRGNTLSWTGVVLQAGEIGFDSQLNEIRIGDGITDWDNLDPVGLNKLQNLSLEQIGDVVVADLTPGDVLIHDGTNWINQQIQFPATDLDDLTSVTLGSPTLGQVLTFNGTVWVNSTPSVLSAGVKNDINVVSDTNWQIVDDSVTQAKLNLDLPVNPWDAATKDYTDTTVGLGVMSIEDQFGQPNGPALLDSTRKIGTGVLATGTASSTTFLRGDRTWATVDSGIPVGVKNDITVVAADDWQITANSIETAMLQANSVNAAKIGGTGITTFGKLLLRIAAPNDQQVPLYSDNEGAWVPTSINDLIGPVALNTVVGIKDVSGGLLGISNQGLVDPSFLSSGYESSSRQVLGNTSWIPEDLYKNPTTDTVAYTDGRSLGTWSLSSLTSGSVIFDNTAIISAFAETANSNAAIKLPTTITANDKSLEFTARVRVRGASITPNTNYVVGLYEMSTGVERYAAVVARDNVSAWTTVAKPDSGASGTSTSTAISCLAWTDVKITIKNNEIKMYINNTLISTTATTAFVGLPLSLGCAVFCEAATSPQAELEVEYMRVSNTDGQLIHPRMIEQAGAITGQVLSWSGSTWQPAAGGVGGATNLDGLSDVTVATPTTGQTLKYNGTVWANSNINVTDITDFQSPVNGQILAVSGGAWTATSLNNLASISTLDPIGITPSPTAGRILLTSLLDGSGASVSEIVHGNFIDTTTIDATFEDRSIGSPTGVAKWKFDVKDSSIGTTKLGGDITTAGKALLDDADAAAQRTTLGLGTAATSNTTAFAAASHTHAGEDITSGTIAAARLGSNTPNADKYLRGDNTWQTHNIDALQDVSVASIGDKQPLAFDIGTLQWTNRTVIRLDALELNTAPAAQSAIAGKIYWDDTRNDLVTPLNGNVLSEIGITHHTRVFNNTGADILKGRVVRVTGSQGQKITVALANASSETTAGTTIGIAAELLNNGSEAFIITNGLLRGINTNTLIKGTTPAEGDALWLNTVDGEITVDRPTAPNHGVFLGWLIRLGSGSSGEIFVKVNNGSELEELHNVLITTPITGHVLRYNGTVWANAALTTADVTGLDTALAGKAATSHTHAASDITAGTIATARLGSGTADSTTFLRGDNTWQTVSGGATNLDSLSDVTVATPTIGQTLKYNGTVWSNSNINLTDITDLQSPTNGQILAVSSGAWTATTLNNVAEVAKLNPIGITPSAAAGRILLTSLLDGSGASVQETVHGNFIDTATIDATFEDRSVGTPTGIAKWKFDVKDSSIGTTKLGGDITTAGKALLDDTDAAAQRTTLGLGTAATSNTSAFAAASHTHAAGDITTGTIAPARLGSGTADSTTFLRGDNTWQTVSGGGATNLDGLSDVVITTPASNNLLGYNGSSWVNRAVNDAIGDATLGVGKLSQGTATNGQVLAWNNIASSWAPADPSGGGATPQGSDGAIQYNSAGSFEGATSTLISANGNIQLNDSTESTGIANSTILFSKSFAGRSLPTIRSGSACPDTNLQICIGRNRIAWANFSGASTTLSTFGIALTTTGTAAAGSLTVSGGTQLARQMRTTYSNTAAINAFAGVRTGSSQVWRGTVANSGGFHIVYRFGRSDAITLCSEYHGVSSTTGAPGAGQVDPVAGSSYANKFGVGIRTTDTNYQLMHCNGNAAATVVDTGIAAVQNVSYRLELFWEPGNSSVMKWLLVREDNDTSATGSASTNLPAQNTALVFTSHRCTVNNNAVVTHNFISYYHEQIGLQ